MLPMSRSSAPDRPYHHGQLRDALLTAAFEQLQEISAHQISLRGVARHAGVSHAAPYHYFPDRAQLLAALAVTCNEQFLDVQRRAVEAQTQPVARLLAMGEAYIQFATQHPNAFALIFDPATCPPDHSNPDTAPFIRANHELLDDLIRAAQDAGQLPKDDPQIRAAALWGTVHGLAQLVQLGHLPAEVVPAALRTLIAPAP